MSFAQEKEKEKEHTEKQAETGIPEEFAKIIKDFIGDIRVTFPEFSPLIAKWWKDVAYFDYIDNLEERNAAYLKAEENSITFIFQFCQKKYPPRFFEILYQNEEMFINEESSVDTEFLPNIHFKNLWSFDITEKTRTTIWKYLQLILFSVIGSLDNREAFGDSAKLFEAINEEDFKGKLEETLTKMQELFNLKEAQNDDSSAQSSSDPNATFNPFDTEGINMENMPNVDELHDHITGMLGGKLGSLAKEIAEETAENLNMDMENVTDMKDIFNKLIKNPTKLMGLVKNVGDKLESRIKSGDIKESELMAEASEIMNKMKNMPGMGDIQAMLSKFGLGGKGGKMNTSAMESQLGKNLKAAQMKERMRAKADAIRAQKELEKKPTQGPMVQNTLSDEQLVSIFSKGEKVERTPRGAGPTLIESNAKPKAKKNKNKK